MLAIGKERKRSRGIVQHEIAVDQEDVSEEPAEPEGQEIHYMI